MKVVKSDQNCSIFTKNINKTGRAVMISCHSVITPNYIGTKGFMNLVMQEKTEPEFISLQ